VLALGIITSLIQKYKPLHIISWFLKHFDRKEHERFPGRGAIFIIAATLLLILLFNNRIVCASIMVWAFGDSIAALVGKHYGKRKLLFNDKKHLEGTIVGIIVATIAATPFVGSLHALIAAGFAMIIEAVEIKILRHDMDDNLLVPIVCAIILYMLSLI
jgi:dolichol kinase